MPSSAFSARAILQKRVFQDTFTRTNASSWGSDYTVTYLQSGGTLSVDGSVGRLTANKGANVSLTTNIAAGAFQFDFYVPANTSDAHNYYSIRGGTGLKGAYVEVYQDTGGTWGADVWPYNGFSIYNFTPDASTWYRIRGVFSGYQNGPSGIKVWKASDPEPTTFGWTSTQPDSSFTANYPTVIAELFGPTAEAMGYDNLEIWSYGPSVDPVVRGSFAANAVRKRLNQPGSFTLDAVASSPYFRADAVIVGNRLKHHRQHDHYGYINDTSVILNGDIEQYPSGTTVHDVLVDLVARLVRVESSTIRTFAFSANAYFRMHIKAFAVIKKTVAPTFTADAWINRSASFTANAFLFGLQARTFTANAYLVDSAEGTWTWAYATPNPADGTTTVFTIPPYKQGTVQAYIDGVAQTPGVDYTETDDTIGTITFTTPPPNGSIVRVHFIACG